MVTEKMDLRGLKCPEPTKKLVVQAMRMRPGDVIEAVADCPTFETDVRSWCQRWKKTLVSVKETQPGVRAVTIQL